MIEIDGFNGLDIDWFAVDKEGKIARLTSNSNGVVFVLHDNFDVLDQIYEYFENISEISQIRDGADAHKDFTDMSKKGLYTFDLMDRSDSYKYKLMTSPTKLLFKSDIDESIVKYLPTLPFSFSSDPIIDLEYLACNNST